MPAIPQYVQRFARLPEVFTILAAHPNGLPLSDLADRVGARPQDLRADLLAFFTADLNGFLGLTRPTTLDFVGPDGAEVDPNEAEVGRLIEDKPRGEIGIEYVDARELGLIYTAAQALNEAEPDNADLHGAIEVLTEAMFGEAAPTPETPARWNAPLVPLQDAARDRHRVKIEYSRAWTEGVIERTIEPYRLVQTRRGWEIDAGPPDPEGKLRTYLLSNLRSFDVLDEVFEVPADIEARLDAQRSTTTVRVRIPHAARWAADVYAEQVRVIEDDEELVTLDLDLLPPADRRVGLLLLAGGLDSSVIDPPGMIRSLGEVAGELLRHHRGESS